MSSIFPQDVQEAAQKMSNVWVKSTEFEGNGILLQIKSVEKVKSQYGANDDSNIVENGILEEGETFRYRFLSEDGLERKYDSTSLPFFIGMQQAEVEVNDWITIRREGKATKTRYFIEKVEHEEVSLRDSESMGRPKYDTKAADDISGSIPFSSS